MTAQLMIEKVKIIMTFTIILDQDLTEEENYFFSKNGYLVHRYNVLKADENDLHYLLSKSGADCA